VLTTEETTIPSEMSIPSETNIPSEMTEETVIIYASKAKAEKHVGELVNSIQSYLEKLSKESTQPYKIYFSGEFDSNQTDFEKQSNHLEIGVIANDKTVGLVLLRFLRIIVDEYPFLIWNSLGFDDGVKKDTTIELKRLVHKMSNYEKTYMASFDLNEAFTVKLYGGHGDVQIEKRLYEVKIWNLQKIFDDLADGIDWTE
jgi:hypothetical protein